MKIIILARTREQAKWFAKENGISQHGFIYPDSPDRIRGLYKPIYVVLETYYMNEKMHTVLDYLKAVGGRNLLQEFCLTPESIEDNKPNE